MLFLSEKTEFNGWLDFDWFIEFDTFEFFIEAIESWNRKNPTNQQTWNAWPADIEAFSMIPKEISDSTNKGEEYEKSLKLDWLNFAKYILDSPSIQVLSLIHI